MEMKTIGERVYIIRKHNKLTQTEFAHKLGLTHATISATEAGKVPITEANLRLICLTFGVNEDWLRTGAGEIFAVEGEEEQMLLDIFRRLSDSGKQDVCEFAEFRLQKEEKELAARRKKSSEDGVRESPSEKAGGTPSSFPLEPLSDDNGGFEEERIVG